MIAGYLLESSRSNLSVSQLASSDLFTDPDGAANPGAERARW
jgi:hypothetical protein